MFGIVEELFIVLLMRVANYAETLKRYKQSRQHFELGTDVQGKGGTVLAQWWSGGSKNT
jgi:hypothetical protein